MLKFAVFLRGVNVNGIAIKMNDLKQLIESLGYHQVRTYLASGNLTCSWDNENASPAPQATVLEAKAPSNTQLSWHKHRIEAALSQHFGYDAHVILKTQVAVNAILQEARHHVIPEGYHHYLLLSTSPESDEGLDAIQNLGAELTKAFEGCTRSEHEVLIVGEHGIYWIVPKGDTLKSDFGKVALGSKAYKARLTSRTLGTIEKMAAF